MASNQVQIDGLKFKETRKKDYDIYMCRPSLGTKVYNKLEGSQYVTDQQRQFVLSGTVGEQWVIDVNKLAKTYTFIDGTEITPETLKKKFKTSDGLIDWEHIKTRQTKVETCFAAHLPLNIKNFPVQTSWGDTLLANRPGIEHGHGDFIVCPSVNGQPNLNDVWVVNGAVFANTYDMRAFPGLGVKGDNAVTPIPKSLIAGRRMHINTSNNGKTSVNVDRLGKFLTEKLNANGVDAKYSAEDSDNTKLVLNGTRYGIQITTLDNSYGIHVINDNGDEWVEIGSENVISASYIFEAICKIIRAYKKSGWYVADYLMTALRQKGDRVGKLVCDDIDNCSFTVNNGRYGVILMINNGNESEFSNSISVMYHNNNEWKEAANWYIDEVGLPESVNKIHKLVGRTYDMTNMVKKVQSSGIPQENTFNNHTIDSDKPAYVRQLLKTYNYVKDKLQLYDNGSLLTETEEEPVHWRMDFSTRLYPKVAPFIDIYPNVIVVCMYTDDDKYEWEEHFSIGADGCKQAFQYIAEKIKYLRANG